MLHKNLKIRIILLFISVLATLSVTAQIKEVPITKAWAKNSVNAVVFRKNSLVTNKGVQFAAFYDSTGYLTLAKRKVGKTNWLISHTNYTGNVKDAHNCISIMLDGEGYLHVSWDHHGNPLHYSRSTTPYGLQLSEMMPMTGTDENNVTYPEFYKLPNGNLLFMYRSGASGRGNLVVNKYNTKQKKWQRLHDVLISGEGKRNAYWQATVDTRGIVHLSWVWRESADVSSNHDLCYARSLDGGETWETTKGAKYQLPITQATAEIADTIPQASELINQTSMFADAQGQPYIATYWKPKEAIAPQYFMVYYNGNNWQRVQVSNRTLDFTLSGVGTKKIPISRPQVIVDTRKNKLQVYYFFRDAERGNKVSVYTCADLAANKWTVQDLTNYAVDDWEPSYDTELWKQRKQIHLYVQRVGQGDGETLDTMPAQTATVLEWKPPVR